MLTLDSETVHVRQMVLVEHESWVKMWIIEPNACVADVRIGSGDQTPKDLISIRSRWLDAQKRN